MPLLSISSPETISNCAKLLLEPSDIFICSYPKSGTTWTQHVVISLLLLHKRIRTSKEKSGAYDIEYTHVSDFAPFFEIDPHWERTAPSQVIADIQKRQNQLGRRVFNTHLRGNMLPTQMRSNISGRAKFIYIVRNPLDACVSFYYHLSNQNEGCYESSLHQFFKDWIDGRIPFGTWAEHILSYAPLIAENSVLLITYEEMVLNLRETVDKIVRYLELDDVLQKRDVDELIPSFTFDAMKKDLMLFQPKSVTWKNGFKFLRKGIIGDSSRELGKEEMMTFEKHLNDINFMSKLECMLNVSLNDSDSNETISRIYNANP